METEDKMQIKDEMQIEHEELVDALLDNEPFCRRLTDPTRPGDDTLPIPIMIVGAGHNPTSTAYDRVTSWKWTTAYPPTSPPAHPPGCGVDWSDAETWCYLDRYQDLQTAYCSNYTYANCVLHLAQCHWLNHGEDENRSSGCSPPSSPPPPLSPPSSPSSHPLHLPLLPLRPLLPLLPLPPPLPLVCIRTFLTRERRAHLALIQGTRGSRFIQTPQDRHS